MDRYPYTNFHELNLVYFLRHFKEIFDQWASLYEEMTSWKASTTEELDAWKAVVLGDIDQWETDLNAAQALWKTDTEVDISTWESTTMAALEAWQTAFETLFSSTFSDISDIKTAAEAAQAAAETAATAAEAAAATFETDKTLSIYNKAADAAATGVLKNAIFLEKTEAYTASDFEQGSYTNTSSGTFNPSNTTIITNRTPIPDDVIAVSTESDLYFDVTGWAGDTFVGHYDDSNAFHLVTPSGHNRYTQQYVDLEKIRFENPTVTALRLSARILIGGESQTTTVDDAVDIIKDLRIKRFLNRLYEASDAGKSFKVGNDGIAALDNDSVIMNLGGIIENSFCSVNTGGFSNNSTFKRTDLIKVIPGVNYYFTGRVYYNSGVAGFNENEAYMTAVLAGADYTVAENHTDELLVIPDGVEYIIACGMKNHDLSITVKGNIRDIMQMEIEDSARDMNRLKKEDCTSISMFNKVGFCGDSYTRGSIGGAETYSEQTAFPNVLARMCGIETSIFAHGGANTYTWLTTFSSTCIGKLETEALTSPCDLYVIMLGINADDTLGTIADINDDSSNSFYGNMGKIYRRISAAAPNAKIILAKPPRIANANNALFTAIDKIAETLSIPTFGCMDDPFYASSFYQENINSLHPIAITYSGMAQAMKRQIQRCMVDYSDYFADYTKS